MGVSGLDNGRKQSRLKPGIKGGRLLSPMRSGLGSGLNNGIMNRKNMQDPTLLIGSKKPLVFWNAENCSVNSSNNLLTVTNLAPSATLTFTVNGSPNRITGDVYGGKAGVSFPSNGAISTSSYLSSTKTETTLFFVVKPTSTTGQYIVISQFTTIQDTPGDFYITASNGVITSTFIGNPNTNTSVISSYPLSTIDYCIVTLKLRLTKTGNDAQELYINGVKQSNYTSSTFTSGTSFSISPLYFDGNSSLTNGGNIAAAGVVFDYYLSRAEQLRIENYLRWYYGRNF